VPELPEVQTIVDVLNAAGLPGKRITGIFVHWPKTVATCCTPEAFCRLLKGKTISGIRRRGKYIIFELSEKFWMLIHLRMTGRLELAARSGQLDRHVHVVINLNDGRRLIYHDTRKFGRFYLTTEPAAIIGSLGPEPLDADFSTKLLAKRLEGRQRQVKPLLLDQSFLAGLGNIYVDEALWLARIHPLRSARTLTRQEVLSLHRAIRSVLRQGIRNAGTSLGGGKGNFISPKSDRGRNKNQLKVFRLTGQPCKRCGHPIERIVVAQRSTHICVRCQL
jgi:formamidopyrimidine-DNA glycosylase